METRVLIVDDSRATRQTLRKLLTELGFKVAGEAENGIEAIDQFTRLKPDLITLDLIMPELDGVGALEEIRKMKSDVKVILVSSIDKGPLITRARELGVGTFITKPVTSRNLRAALEQIKKRKAA